MELFEQNYNQLQMLCNQYHVKHLYAFGSVLTNRFNQNSDIDFLVDFGKVNRRKYADNLYALQDLFHREIDLLESKAITNPYLKSNINSTKQLVYG